MPILRFEDAPEYDLAGARIRGFASPSRGATETMCWRIELGPAQTLPPHRHDREEVVHVVSGSLTAVLDGKETAVAEGDTVMIPAGTLHRTFTRESERAMLLAMMPAGTIMIRPDGERVVPPWTE